VDLWTISDVFDITCFSQQARVLQDLKRFYVQTNLRLVKFFCRDRKAQILQHLNIQKCCIISYKSPENVNLSTNLGFSEITCFSQEAGALQDLQRFHVRTNLRLVKKNFIDRKAQILQNLNIQKSCIISYKTPESVSLLANFGRFRHNVFFTANRSLAGSSKISCAMKSETCYIFLAEIAKHKSYKISISRTHALYAINHLKM